MRHPAILSCLLLTLCTPSGCIFPPKRDANTLSALKSLSVDSTGFYADAVTEKPDYPKWEKVSQSIGALADAQALRGRRNDAQTGQVRAIRQMLDRHIEERKAQGVWTEKFAALKARNLQEMFDVAKRIERGRPE